MVWWWLNAAYVAGRAHVFFSGGIPPQGVRPTSILFHPHTSYRFDTSCAPCSCAPDTIPRAPHTILMACGIAPHNIPRACGIASGVHHAAMRCYAAGTGAEESLGWRRCAPPEACSLFSFAAHAPCNLKSMHHLYSHCRRLLSPLPPNLALLFAPYLVSLHILSVLQERWLDRPHNGCYPTS